jgi:hypothetical protein
VQKSFIKPIAVVLVAIVVLFSLGFRLGHPKDGLSNALGSANSGLVIYHKSSVITVGTKVFSVADAPSKSPVLALVTAINGDQVDLQAGTKLLRVKKTQVSGKLLAVVPFIGSILSVVGL